jgi:hypothetical protein
MTVLLAKLRAAVSIDVPAMSTGRLSHGEVR